MPTPFESATLILTLYEQRREETMRKARDFVFTFDPRSADEFIAGMFGPQSALIRQVITYWDMVGSLLENGAIDKKMFYESGGEFIAVYGKIDEFLPEIRTKLGMPLFAVQLEKLALGVPDARQRIDATRARIREMLSKMAGKTQA